MKENIKNVIWITLVLAIAEAIFLYVGDDSENWEGTTIEQSSVDYWQMFAGISKERKYIEEVSAYYRIPVFTPELMAHSGKMVTLSGYYLPYSRLDSVIVLSRYPNSSCFFCGQAGIESVAMVELGKTDQDDYRMDQMLIVQGKLVLNSTDVNKLAFVIKDAIIEEVGL